MLRNPNYVYGSPEISVPVKLNFGDFLLKKLMEHKSKTAIINAATHESKAYGQIAQEAMNVAVSLTRLGVRKGDVVAICSENRQEFHSTAIGVSCTGAVLTVINIAYTQDELKHVLNISKPTYLFCSTLAYKINEEIFKSNKLIKKIIIFGDKKLDSALLFKDLAITPNNWLQKDVSYSEFDVVDVLGQTDTLFILYSSGTTGLPKGVMMTHLNVISVMCSGFDTSINVLYENTVSLNIAPWFHSLGLLVSLGALNMGIKTVYMPSFDIELYLDTIEKYKITQLIVVPPLLVALCKLDPKQYLSTVIEIYSGGSPLLRETVMDAKVRFPNLKAVFQVYGLTECPVSKDNGDVSIAKPGSVGTIVGGVVLKIVDTETRKPLGPNQQGEICVKGATMMKGYVGKDKGNDFDEEGFFKTGDIGYYDEDRRHLFVVDRLKELIKYKGYQVPPAEIEIVLLQHEAVQDVGVVGMADKVGGEVPVAFVVIQPGKMVSENELIEFVAKRLSHHKHLRGGVRFIDAIPRNPSGKILRRELKKIINTGKSKL